MTTERHQPKPLEISETPFVPRLLAEGKTKRIFETANPLVVRIESKDDITAGDGVKRDVIEGKAATATRTTVNVFQLLEAYGIPTHFVAQDSETSFIAQRAQMIPLECVARRVATGSFLKRHPGVAEGHTFNDIPVEFYYKDDSRHDPILGYDARSGVVQLYDAKDPLNNRTPIAQTSADEIGATTAELEKMSALTVEVFTVIERVWSEQDVALIDLKIEFGRDQQGNLIVADVIDNDSWRIWEGGDKTRMLDKQRYRNGEDLAQVRRDYEQVALRTNMFARPN